MSSRRLSVKKNNFFEQEADGPSTPKNSVIAKLNLSGLNSCRKNMNSQSSTRYMNLARTLDSRTLR